MTLKQQIQNDNKTAFKNKESDKVSALRFLLSQIKYQEIENQKEVTDNEILAIIQKEVKKRNQAIEMFIKAGRDELVSLEKQKLVYLQSYLPKTMDDQVLEEIIIKAVSGGNKNFGSLMKEIIAKTKGQADGSKIALLLKKYLQSKN